MSGQGACRPEHAVFRVQLGRERPPRQTGVHPVFGEPGRELAVAVEGESETGVADDVVDRAEAVVGPTDRNVEEGVVTVAVEVRGAQLEHAL